MSESLRLAVRAALLRLKRPDAIAWCIGALLLALLDARVQRALAPRGAVDRALLNESASLLLPILGFVVFDRVLDSGRSERFLSPILRHGGNGRSAWLGMFATLATLLGLMGGLIAALQVLVAHDPRGPGIWRDLSQSVWILACAGVAYSAWLSLGSSFGRRGQGRLWLLVVDLILGSTNSWAAALCPRPHLRNLLGGTPLLHFGQGSALLALFFGTVFAVAAARARIRA